MLESATDFVPPAVWTNAISNPAVVNGQNIVTNPISAAQQFFRLRQ
jgi:hypothetical protein